MQIPASEASPALSRIHSLDGLRGIAILLALLHHYVHNQLHNAAPGSIVSKLRVLLDYCWTGVDLFFVLSGFLIGGIILDQGKSKNFLRAFFIRRAARILPVYITLLIAYILTKPIFGTTKGYDWLYEANIPFYSYPLFLQNYFFANRGTWSGNFLSITWSLAVEEQFYLLLPLLFTKFGKTTFVYSIIVLVFVAPILRILSYGGMISYVSMPHRMDALLIGVIVALLYRNVSFRSIVEKHSTVLPFLFIVLTIGLVTNHFRNQMAELRGSWIAITYATILLMCLSFRGYGFQNVMQFSALSFLGKYSYGIYMYHQAVAGLLRASFFNDHPTIDSAKTLTVTFLALIITLLSSVLSFHFLESPILRLARTSTYASQ